MPIRRTKKARPKARKFELSNTATPRESKIRKSPDPELQSLLLAGFACVDKTPVFRDELLKECRYCVTFCQVTAFSAGTASYPEPAPQPTWSQSCLAARNARSASSRFPSSPRCECLQSAQAVGPPSSWTPLGTSVLESRLQIPINI